MVEKKMMLMISLNDTIVHPHLFFHVAKVFFGLIVHMLHTLFTTKLGT